ncbi:MAG TPA: DUF3047 domain-containing protein [Candidatus Competibacteraceae bacterium]|nr:DUF3047 domain-containing protein [Candidatus Competibacteraceae bacterium]
MKRPALLLLLLPLLASASERVPVGEFAAGRLDGWRPQTFRDKAETRYRLEEVDGRRALRAEANSSASGLIRELPVDLSRTPYLHWSWRIERSLAGLDERRKGGDDFPVRVYVVAKGLLFWQTRSLLYVWSGSQPAGSQWANPYTGNARMIALRSGDGEAGRWLEERRDVRADWRQAFGEDITRLDGVAIMTDGDDSRRHSLGWYGDIYFASD